MIRTHILSLHLGPKNICGGPTSFEHQMAGPLTPRLHNRFSRSGFWGKSWCGANEVERGGGAGDPENYKEERQFFIKKNANGVISLMCEYLD